MASVALEAVMNNLDGYIKEETVRKWLDDVCLARLPEALFAEAVTLVEGDNRPGRHRGLP